MGTRRWRIDVSKAAALPAWCAHDWRGSQRNGEAVHRNWPDVGQKIADYPMAVDKVTFQGEPVAAVIARRG